MIFTALVQKKKKLQAHFHTGFFSALATHLEGDSMGNCNFFYFRQVGYLKKKKKRPAGVGIEWKYAPVECFVSH